MYCIYIYNYIIHIYIHYTLLSPEFILLPLLPLWLCWPPFWPWQTQGEWPKHQSSAVSIPQLVDWYDWFPAIVFFKHQPSTCHVCWSNVYVKSINHVQSILVGGFNPLWKIWKSVGMIIPNIWKNKSHVPNHQPDNVQSVCSFAADPVWFQVFLAANVELFGSASTLTACGSCSSHPMRFTEPGDRSWKKRGCPQLCWCGLCAKISYPKKCWKKTSPSQTWPIDSGVPFGHTQMSCCCYIRSQYIPLNSSN